MMRLADHQLHRALDARDPRFDGVFFVGITSTRIYCRPVCPAPRSRRERRRFFASAAAAERRGFRPCLRCRPELAPGDAGPASVDAVAGLARAAAERIAAGALDHAGLDALATSLGVTARHVRRVVERELGATPVELAQTRRLLTAKQLLTDTDLSVTQIALASGFASIRRFNALFHDRYRLAPSALRRQSRTTGGTPIAPGHELVSLTLAYRPPFDWEAMLAWFASRAIPGVESVTPDGRYWRSVRVGTAHGVIAVSRPAGGRRDSVRLELSPSLVPSLVPLLARVRRMLDLDAAPGAITDHLSRDAALAPLVKRRPGLRVPGAFDGFELALRAILGQQVTVRAGTTLAGRLAERVAEPLAERSGAPLTHLPVEAGRLADLSPASLAGIGLPRARAVSLVALARAVADGALPELVGSTTVSDPLAVVRRLTSLPGIGPWTAEYVAMRALRWPDAFPEGDLGLRKAMGALTPARLRARSEAWSPWRAYAAQHLWARLGDSPLPSGRRSRPR